MEQSGDTITSLSARSGLNFRMIGGVLSDTRMSKDGRKQHFIGFDLADALLCALNVSPLIWHEPPLNEYAEEAIRMQDSRRPIVDAA